MNDKRGEEKENEDGELNDRMTDDLSNMKHESSARMNQMTVKSSSSIVNRTDDDHVVPKWNVNTDGDTVNPNLLNTLDIDSELSIPPDDSRNSSRSGEIPMNGTNHALRDEKNQSSRQNGMNRMRDEKNQSGVESNMNEQQHAPSSSTSAASTSSQNLSSPSPSLSYHTARYNSVLNIWADFNNRRMNQQQFAAAMFNTQQTLSLHQQRQRQHAETSRIRAGQQIDHGMTSSSSSSPSSSSSSTSSHFDATPSFSSSSVGSISDNNTAHHPFMLPSHPNYLSHLNPASENYNAHCNPMHRNFNAYLASSKSSGKNDDALLGSLSSRSRKSSAGKKDDVKVDVNNSTGDRDDSDEARLNPDIMNPHSPHYNIFYHSPQYYQNPTYTKYYASVHDNDRKNICHPAHRYFSPYLQQLMEYDRKMAAAGGNSSSSGSKSTNSSSSSSSSNPTQLQSPFSKFSPDQLARIRDHALRYTLGIPSASSKSKSHSKSSSLSSSLKSSSMKDSKSTTAAAAAATELLNDSDDEQHARMKWMEFLTLTLQDTIGSSPIWKAAADTLFQSKASASSTSSSSASCTDESSDASPTNLTLSAYSLRAHMLLFCSGFGTDSDGAALFHPNLSDPSHPYPHAHAEVAVMPFPPKKFFLREEVIKYEMLLREQMKKEYDGR